MTAAPFATTCCRPRRAAWPAGIGPPVRSGRLHSPRVVSCGAGGPGFSSTGDGVLEPQSTGLFIVLMGAFCALLGCVAAARQLAVKVLAASLAFVPAMLFGVAAVNKYYDYYQTWGAAAADLGPQGLSSGPQLPSGASRQQLPRAPATATGGTPACPQAPTR